MMTNRPRGLVLLVAGLCTIIAAGCHGPTARGIENRRAANDRFDRAGAQIAYDQAQQSLINGQYKLALDTIDQAIRRFPQEASYVALRGRIQQEMRQYEGAQRTFEYALSIDPTCHECLYYLGVEAQRRSDDVTALARYDAAWSLEPSRLQYAAAGVECCLAMDDLAGAEERLCTADQFFGQAAALSALRAELHALQGDDARALQHARQAALQSGDGLAEESIWRMFRAGDWRGCLDALAKPAAAELAAREDMQRLRARCLMMTGAAAAARDQLVTAELSMREPTPEHMVLLGQAAWACGDWARVERSAAWLMARQPDAADGYVLAAGAAFARGELDRTTGYLDRVDALEPGRSVVASLRRKVLASQILAAGAHNPAEPQPLPMVSASASGAAIAPPATASTAARQSAATPLAAASPSQSAQIPFAE
jgi:tetratricopeptide (TPR) repeat protein